MEYSSLAIILLASTAGVGSGIPLEGEIKYENCNGAYMCGVLTLETGLGNGYYNSSIPVVHGLWPETGTYGSSPCIKPSVSDADPTFVFPCYTDPDTDDQSHQISFETHEWGKHGMCAGVKDATDFFDQICDLSAAPIVTLSDVRDTGTSHINDYAFALMDAGYPVVTIDLYEGQIELSTCAGPDGRWRIADKDQFALLCSATDAVPTEEK